MRKEERERRSGKGRQWSRGRGGQKGAEDGEDEEGGAGDEEQMLSGRGEDYKDSLEKRRKKMTEF